MKKQINVFKINIIFCFLISEILMMIKKDVLDNIIIFENTNGDIYLNQDLRIFKFIFGTTSSDKKERIFFGIKDDDDNEKYYLKKNGNIYPSIKKDISLIENKEIPNSKIILIEKEDSFFTILIGSDNSNIEIINLNSNTNDIVSIPQLEFFHNIGLIKKGITSFLSYSYNKFYHISPMILDDDPTHYSINYNLFTVSCSPGQTTLNFELRDHQHFNTIKGDYMSCDMNNGFITCFYLDNDNDYKITFITEMENQLETNQTFPIGRLSNPIDEELYFLGAKIESLNNGIYCGIYAYYSGESNEIPTFVFLQIKENYTYENMYSNYPFVYLGGYSFHNGIKYNDLCIYKATKNGIDLFFISTHKNKEYLIIAYIKVYESTSSTPNTQLLIRYFTLKLKDYFDMKIFHGIKAIILNRNKQNWYLTLSFDFILTNNQNEISNNENGNAGLIMLSYINETESNVDFIEQAFKNNAKYIIANLFEACIINNNIFGYEIKKIILQSMTEDPSDYNEIEYGIEYYDEIRHISADDEEFLFVFENEAIIRVDLSNFNFEESTYEKINIVYQINLFPFKINDLCDKINNSLGNQNDQSLDNNDVMKKQFFFNYNIILSQKMTTHCNVTNCTLCLFEDQDYCIVCEDGNYSIIPDEKYGKRKICWKDQNTQSEITTEFKNISIEIEDLLNDKYINISLSSENIKDIYEELKEYIKDSFNGNNVLINTSNVKIQISNLDSQTISKDLSYIDLGECGNKLKEKYCKLENDSLILLKFDIKPNDEKSTYVKYEIYDSYNKTKIDLQECSDINVFMDIPIEFSSEIESLYEMLAKAGYDLFNAKSSFYNDICTTYTNEEGSDVLLYDRRMDIYKETVNVSLCQDGCEFKSYDKVNKKAKCQCSSKDSEIDETELAELKFGKNSMIKEFYTILDNSNFRVLKCYKLIFKLKSFSENIGSIIMIILLSGFISLMIVFILKSSKKINLYIQEILKNKFFKKDNDNNNISLVKEDVLEKNNINGPNNGYPSSNLKNKRRKKNKIKRVKIVDSELKNNSIIGNTIMDSKKDAPPRKKRKTKTINQGDNTNSRNLIMNKINEQNPIPSTYIRLSNVKHSTNIFRKSIKINQELKNEVIINDKLKFETNNLIINDKLKFETNNDIIKNKEKILCKSKETNLIGISKLKLNNNAKDYINKTEKTHGEEIVETKTDEELNSLEYQKAIEFDKRSYFQYYFALLKKKQLIIFTFFTSNDYNVLSIKISLFIVSFSLYLTINGFFFNDKTMHKIYKENGSFNIVYQLPQILYSTIISAIINAILKQLSLSEKDIIKIKQEKDMNNSAIYSKKIEKCIKIKFVIFFIISFLLMFFFWYFISCFCAVYKNTQIILFKDTLISFSISMLYPFGINLIPGLLRIPALKAEKKDKKNLYIVSQYVALV